MLPTSAMAVSARAITSITPQDQTLPDPNHRSLVSSAARYVSRLDAHYLGHHPPGDCATR
ncbi:hypothetical protein ACFVH4_09525 [Nocardia ignorata]|uniref:hypothetical protein n=1 Tax=Nocardia ignorata TaxID=145285 RepID=UPI00362536EC